MAKIFLEEDKFLKKQQLRNRFGKQNDNKHTDSSLTKLNGINLLKEYKKLQGKVKNETNGTMLNEDDVINVLKLFLANTQHDKIMNPEATCCMCCLCWLWNWNQCSPIRIIRDHCCIGRTKKCLCPDTLNRGIMSGLHWLFHTCSNIVCCHNTQRSCEQVEKKIFFPKVIPNYVLIYALSLRIWNKKERDFLQQRFKFQYRVPSMIDLQIKTNNSITSEDGGELRTLEDFIRNFVREEFVSMMLLLRWGYKDSELPDFLVQTLISYLYGKKIIVSYSSNEWSEINNIIDKHDHTTLYFGTK